MEKSLSCEAKQVFSWSTNAPHFIEHEVHASPPHFLKIKFNIILQLRLGLPSGLIISGLPTKTIYTTLFPPYVPHASPISFIVL
jgi:hypothetical protein